MVRIFIPTQLRKVTGGATHVDLEAANVREAIQKLDTRFPGFAKSLLSEGMLARGVAVSIDGSVSPRGALATLTTAREVHFVPAIGGG
jgi:molybdopterin converting factor small subunit